MIRSVLLMWEYYKKGFFKGRFHHTDKFNIKDSVSAESRVLHFTSMTHRMGISKPDMRGKCLLVHFEAATIEGAISQRMNCSGQTMKIMTHSRQRWALLPLDDFLYGSTRKKKKLWNAAAKRGKNVEPKPGQKAQRNWHPGKRTDGF